MPLVRGESEGQPVSREVERRISDGVPKHTRGQRLLRDVKLAVGTNVIAHRLGRKLQGWSMVRPRGVGAFAHPVETASDATTLTLGSSAAVTVDLEVW